MPFSLSFSRSFVVPGSWSSGGKESTEHYVVPATLPETVGEAGQDEKYKKDFDNDNDNDTLREVPHPSNEGLALQARVSGP